MFERYVTNSYRRSGSNAQDLSSTAAVNDYARRWTVDGQVSAGAH